MCELISPRQLLFSQKYFLNIFFHHKLLVKTLCAALFQKYFLNIFFITSFWWRLLVLLFSQKYFQNVFYHKLLVETSCAALSPVVCLFLLSVGLVPVDRQRHKIDSSITLENAFSGLASTDYQVELLE